MDAYTYIFRGEVFANAQTGNILLLGVYLSEGNYQKALSYFFPVAAFAFGIVIAEADILGKPVISTDIIGPRKFMKNNGGYLVENSEKGLTFGIEKLLKKAGFSSWQIYSDYRKNPVCDKSERFVFAAL